MLKKTELIDLKILLSMEVHYKKQILAIKLNSVTKNTNMLPSKRTHFIEMFCYFIFGYVVSIL